MKVLTVKAAASRLGCTPSSLYLAIQEGRLKHIRQLERIGLREQDVKEYGERLGRANGWTKRARPQLEPMSAPTDVKD